MEFLLEPPIIEHLRDSILKTFKNVFKNGQILLLVLQGL